MNGVAVSNVQNLSAARFAPVDAPRPILILTIKNGAAHTRAAEAIAAAWRKTNPNFTAQVVDVADFMSPLARFTHITAYLWLVKNAPRAWGKIDRYQKRQTQTSPEWFYRRECRKLFDLAREMNPSAIVATEVGCGEIAALIKRDLNLEVPLVAASLDFDADRAWIQPETDLYCLATDSVEKDFIKLGAAPEKIEVWGVPLSGEFKRLSETERETKRAEICERLELDPNEPLVLISGGGEGLGKIEAILQSLFELETSIVVLCGRNRKLKNACEKLAEKRGNARVFGWTETAAEFVQIADAAVSKLGLSFYEATACGLPIVALEPPPGAERIQYDALETLGVGRAVKTLDEMTRAVREILSDKNVARKMRENARKFSRESAAPRIAEWLAGKVAKTTCGVL